MSDNWKPTRYLEITPSLSHSWVAASDSRGYEISNTQSFAPGFAAIWDPTRDGRTAL